ncbi:MAG TPA: hypothetical protein VHJ34_05715 [Actinomycetota bacterium]|nr:hypothetical protein [Actinomycetota bacterium]
MDWTGWATFGFGATAALTAVLVAAQLSGHTRMDIPMMLGTIVVEDPDRARVVGALMHLVNGQLFALFYAAGFSALGRSEWWLGALFGLLHGITALTLIIPLLPGVHPRMGSDRSGPGATVVLEPPGLFATNYGRGTAVVTLVAHVAYGVILALVLSP